MIYKDKEYRLTTSLEDVWRNEDHYQFEEISPFITPYFSCFPIPYEAWHYGENTKKVISQGRIYSIQLYLVDDKLVTYDELLKIRGELFKGIYDEVAIRLVEYWSDSGSDGHVEYRLIGYIFMDAKNPEIQELIEGKFFWKMYEKLEGKLYENS